MTSLLTAVFQVWNCWAINSACPTIAKPCIQHEQARHAASQSQIVHASDMLPNDVQGKEVNMDADAPKKFRAQMLGAYQKLKAAKQLSTGLHGTDITEALAPYIHPGMSFTDAERFLSEAGFEVGERPKASKANDPNKGPEWYAVLASTSPPDSAFSSAKIFVVLLPEKPDAYTTVTRVRASIILAFL